MVFPTCANMRMLANACSGLSAFESYSNAGALELFQSLEERPVDLSVLAFAKSTSPEFCAHIMRISAVGGRELVERTLIDDDAVQSLFRTIVKNSL